MKKEFKLYKINKKNLIEFQIKKNLIVLVFFIFEQ